MKKGGLWCGPVEGLHGVLSGWWVRVICIDDVLSLFAEREQVFVRYDLEAVWGAVHGGSRGYCGLCS